MKICSKESGEWAENQKALNLDRDPKNKFYLKFHMKFNIKLIQKILYLIFYVFYCFII